MKSAEIVLAMHNKPTKVDPFYAPAAKFIGSFFRILNTNKNMESKFQEMLKLKSEATRLKRNADQGFNKHFDEVLSHMQM